MRLVSDQSRRLKDFTYGELFSATEQIKQKEGKTRKKQNPLRKFKLITIFIHVSKTLCVYESYSKYLEVLMLEVYIKSICWAGTMFL